MRSKTWGGNGDFEEEQNLWILPRRGLRNSLSGRRGLAGTAEAGFEKGA